MGPTCSLYLADFEPVLPALALLIEADYRAGAFEIVEEQFAAAGAEQAEWHLEGEFGYVRIVLEKYEGYFLCEFCAPEPAFTQGKSLLRAAYLAQGGSAGALER